MSSQEKKFLESEFQDKDEVGVQISRWRRWTIYIIGLFETFVFGGCIFGWAQLVYVLKNKGIFYDVCTNNSSAENSTNIYVQEESEEEDMKMEGCPEQDQTFALIYTIACVAYGTPGVLYGMILHHCGLAVSRVMASLMLGFGFLALGCTSQENPEWIYIAMTLLAVGGNQIRLSGVQFCNLFPHYRSTALTIISGSFAASAGLFLIFQIGQNYGLTLWTMSVCLSCLAFMSLPATLLMPWHHIPNENEKSKAKDFNSNNDEVPLLKSVFSLSNFTNSYWLFMNLTGVTFFAVTFNSWISKISLTNEEAARYSSLYSVGSFICPLFTPFPGLLTDYLFRKASREELEEKRLEKELMSPLLPTTLVVLVCLFMQSCLFFNNKVAVYLSLIALTILRPSIIAVGYSFMRIRFPANHFDRLNGISGTIVSLLGFVQYPLFLWAQYSYNLALLFFSLLIGITLIHPLHLLWKSYRKKVVRSILGSHSQTHDSLIKAENPN